MKEIQLGKGDRIRRAVCLTKQKDRDTMKKLLKIVLGLLVTIGIFIASMQMTPYSMVYLMRAVFSLVQIQGNMGEYEAVINDVQEAGTVEVAVENLPNPSFKRYAPKGNTKNLPVIFYIHGGGWSLGNADSVSHFAKLLASNGFAVVNIDYSLAPEHPYPTSTLQLLEIMHHVYENAEQYHVDKENIFIGGNSAGAHLASQLGALFSNEGLKEKMGVSTSIPLSAIKGLLLYNGVYNFDTTHDSDFPVIHQYIWAYTGVKDYAKFERLDELSTVKNLTEHYPASFITAGDADPLLGQTLALIDEMEDKSIPHTAIVWEKGSNLNHDYVYDLNKKEAIYLYERTVEFLNRQLGRQ